MKNTKEFMIVLAVALTGIVAFRIGQIYTMSTLEGEPRQGIAPVQFPGMQPIANVPPKPAGVRPVPVSDFLVTVLRAETAPRYQIKGAFGSTPSVDQPCIIIYFEMKNASEARKYDGGSWPTAQLTDEHGNHFECVTDDHPSRPDKIPTVLKPGESIKDVLVFECPLPQSKILTFAVQDHFSSQTGIPRSTVEIEIKKENILDPNGLLHQ